MSRTLTNAITLFVAPFFAAVSLAATPVKVEQVQAGLEVAIARQAIPKNGALQTGVMQFLSLLKSGVTPEDASRSTGVKLAVISRLQQLGAGHARAVVQVKRQSEAIAIPPVQVTVPVVLKTEAIAQSSVQSAAQPVAVAPSGLPAVAPDPVKTDPKLAMATTPQQLANAIVRGLTVANRMGEIGYKANLSARVQSVVRSLRRGMDLEKATQSWGVSEKTVKRLLFLGNYQSSS
jgi:uncharacterized protein YerC